MEALAVEIIDAILRAFGHALVQARVDAFKAARAEVDEEQRKEHPPRDP